MSAQRSQDCVPQEPVVRTRRRWRDARNPSQHPQQLRPPCSPIRRARQLHPLYRNEHAHSRWAGTAIHDCACRHVPRLSQHAREIVPLFPRSRHEAVLQVQPPLLHLSSFECSPSKSPLTSRHQSLSIMPAPAPRCFDSVDSGTSVCAARRCNLVQMASLTATPL